MNDKFSLINPSYYIGVTGYTDFSGKPHINLDIVRNKDFLSADLLSKYPIRRYMGYSKKDAIKKYKFECGIKRMAVLK